MSDKCLMLTTSDKTFYTELDNKPDLNEFCRVFNIKSEIVDKSQNKLSNLEEIAYGFCHTVYKSKAEKKNKETTSTEKLREFIINEFKNSNAVSLKSITKHFPKDQISIPTIYNHLKKAKEILSKEGYKFRKVSVGTYQATHLADN